MTGEETVIVLQVKTIRVKKDMIGSFGLPQGYDHKYIYSHVGYNLKSTDMQAALGVSQLKNFPNLLRSGNKILIIFMKSFQNSRNLN